MAILGLHNYNGTLAVYPSGYNYTVWNANNEAWRFTCNCTECIVLPVELLNFNGKAEKPGVNHLYWQTATESNSSHFTVQRLRTQDQFEDIGDVPAAGNSNEIRQYEFVDNNAPDGYAYYRLKQVDKDGQEYYSNVIMVGIATDPVRLINTYPNPVENELYLSIQSDGTPFKLILMDQQGHQWILDDAISYHGNLKLKYDMTNFAPGTYTLQAISDKNQVLFKTTIVKNK